MPHHVLPTTTCKLKDNLPSGRYLNQDLLKRRKRGQHQKPKHKGLSTKTNKSISKKAKLMMKAMSITKVNLKQEKKRHWLYKGKWLRTGSSVKQTVALRQLLRATSNRKIQK